jgi:hypothetical protein
MITHRLKKPCCIGQVESDGTETFVPAILNMKFRTMPIMVLIDTGCGQSNVVGARLAAMLRSDGCKFLPANVGLRA